MQLLKKSEVAAILRVTPRTVENYLKQGRIPAPVRIGNRPLWPACAIQALLVAPTGESE